MNTLRQTCAASILSLALAISAFAGQIDSPGYVPPPPPSPTQTTSSLPTTLILTVLSLIR